MDLGTTIKNIRKSQGLKQGEFAIKCGITQTYLSQIESNSKEPNLSTIRLISDKLNLPIPILFFLSMTSEDVHPSKREAYKILGPSINSFVNEFFSI